LIGLGASDTLIGGTEDGAPNVISGNGYFGVEIADPGTTGNIVRGNFIGTDASGTSGLPNGAEGVRISRGASYTLIGGTEPDAGNLISGNGDAGVRLEGAGTEGNMVQGNYIGTDLAGTSPLGNLSGVWVTDGAADNLIGGKEDGARNVVSGNLYNVVLSGGGETTRNIVEGNYIGTDRSGSIALVNSAIGVAITESATGNLIGGTEDGARNIISGASFTGVYIYNEGTTGNTVQGNYIGTDAGGTVPIGNLFSGVFIGSDAADNLIGGTEPGAGNTIAFNAGAGIILGSAAGSGNALLSNSVFLNEGLGINLGFDGVTPNDPLDGDTGPNGLQNYPAITAIRHVGRAVMIFGTLDSTPSTIFRLEFFSNVECDPSGYGEGQAFLGFGHVKTNQAGFASFIITLPVSLPRGAFVTVTATDPGGSTSEFSACFAP
jgi:titin